MPGERKDYISWDEYFMGIALLSAERSKDPRTRVGACIVDKDNHILSTGYNSACAGMSDKYDMPWASEGEQTGDKMKIKDYFVVHAEENAIDNYLGPKEKLNGATLYVTLFPCYKCAQKIARSGIKKIVYLNMYKKEDINEISKYILSKANVEWQPYKAKEEVLELKSKVLEKLSNN